MRTIDQFRALFAKIADGIAGARLSSDFDHASHERNGQSSLPTGDQRIARATQIVCDDEKRAQPPSGSYPAVWPR
jgi:hypothetical protein